MFWTYNRNNLILIIWILSKSIFPHINNREKLWAGLATIGLAGQVLV